MPGRCVWGRRCPRGAELTMTEISRLLKAEQAAGNPAGLTLAHTAALLRADQLDAAADRRGQSDLRRPDQVPTGEHAEARAMAGSRWPCRPHLGPPSRHDRARQVIATAKYAAKLPAWHCLQGVVHLEGARLSYVLLTQELPGRPRKGLICG